MFVSVCGGIREQSVERIAKFSRLSLRQPEASDAGTAISRVQVADVTIQKSMSAEGRRDVDLWTG